MESELGDVDDGSLRLVLCVLGLGGLGEEAPEAVDVDGRAEVSVEVPSEDSDALLSEVARMVLEDVGSLMGQTSGLSSTGWMLPVFSDSTVSV